MERLLAKSVMLLSLAKKNKIIIKIKGCNDISYLIVLQIETLHNILTNINSPDLFKCGWSSIVANKKSRVTSATIKGSA
jgi:hypothetical protein